MLQGPVGFGVGTEGVHVRYKVDDHKGAMVALKGGDSLQVSRSYPWYCVRRWVAAINMLRVHERALVLLDAAGASCLICLLLPA
jgi:hypothetical protein